MTTEATAAARRQFENAATPDVRGPDAADGGRRTAILRAALEVFARDGFDGASMPKIAREAAVGHPLIHYYFGSKDNLWREAVAHAFGALMSDVATLDTTGRDLSPLDRLRLLVRTFTLFAARNPSHFALIMTESRADTERSRWLQKTYVNDFVRRLRRTLTEAQDAKQIKAIPVDHLDRIIMGSVLLYFSANFGLADDIDPDTVATEHADYVLETVLNGIALPQG